jgi:uncharacterized protein YxjI
MFDRRQYLIREHVGFLKLKDAYDVIDPTTNEHLGYVTETTSGWILWLRLLLGKARTPIRVELRRVADGAPQLRLEQGWTWWRSTVRVTDGAGQPLGHLESKLLTIGGGFQVYSAAGARIAEVRGKWHGWSFRFLDAAGRQIGRVAKKWTGVGKELFTSADDYLIEVQDQGPQQPLYGALLLAAGLALDFVYNETRSQATGGAAADYSTPGASAGAGAGGSFV